MEIFWELHQQRNIEQARSDAAISQQRAETALEHNRQLEARINQLVLVNMALWSLVKEATGLTDEQLTQRMQQLSQTEAKPSVTACPKCGKNMSQRHNRCLYCGFEPEETNAFNKVLR